MLWEMQVKTDTALELLLRRLEKVKAILSSAFAVPMGMLWECFDGKQIDAFLMTRLDMRLLKTRLFVHLPYLLSYWRDGAYLIHSLTNHD